MSQEFFDKLVKTLELSNKKALEEANLKQTADIKEYINDELKNLKNTFEEEINKKTAELEEKYLNLKTRYEKLEKELRKNNVIIFGLENPQENCCDYVISKLNTLLGVNITRNDINNLYPIGKQTIKRPIIVKFTSYLTKQEVLKNGKKLKNTNISIADELTLEERREKKILWQHLKKAREAKLNAFIKSNRLTINGTVYTAQQLACEEEDTDSETEQNTNIEDLLNAKVHSARLNNSAPPTPSKHIQSESNEEEVFDSREQEDPKKRKPTADHDELPPAKIVTRSTSGRERKNSEKKANYV